MNLRTPAWYCKCTPLWLQLNCFEVSEMVLVKKYLNPTDLIGIFSGSNWQENDETWLKWKKWRAQCFLSENDMNLQVPAWCHKSSSLWLQSTCFSLCQMILVKIFLTQTDLICVFFPMLINKKVIKFSKSEEKSFD